MSYIRIFKISALSVVLLLAGVAWFWPPVLWSLVVLGPLLLLGFYDLVERTHNVTRNFPIIGHLRYLFEAVRPEISVQPRAPERRLPARREHAGHATLRNDP